MSDETGDGGRVFRSTRHRRVGVAAAALLVVAATVGSLLLWRTAPWLFDPVELRGRVAALGPGAPLAFVVLQAAQVVLAPIPGQVLAGIGGYLFGPLRGALYSLAGVVVGSLVVFGAARRYGRPFVARLVTAETLSRFDGFVDRYGVPGLFLVFLLPTFPDDAICLVAGLSPIRTRTFLLLLVVGRAPTFVATAYAGGGLAAGDYGEVALVVAGLVALTVVVSLVRSRVDDGGSAGDG